MNNTPEQVIDRLRGQLQNCVNVLSAVNRGRWMKDKVNEHIEAANKCLYETLHADISSAPTPPASVESCNGRLAGSEVIYRCSYCQTVYFDTDHHCECLPHGAKPEFSEWVMVPKLTAAPTPPARAEPMASYIPKQMLTMDVPHYIDGDLERNAYAEGFNVCRERLLNAAPTPPASAEGLDKEALTSVLAGVFTGCSENIDADEDDYQCGYAQACNDMWTRIVDGDFDIKQGDIDAQ